MAYVPFKYPDICDMIRRQSNTNLKIANRNLIDIYKDNWVGQLKSELASQFDKKTYARLNLLASTEFNILKRVVNETSMLYKKPAQRAMVLKSVEGAEQKIDENYQKMLSSTMIDVIMKQVNRYTSFLNQTVLRPVMRSGKMEYDFFTFDNIEVVTDPNDWRKIIAYKFYTALDLNMRYTSQYDATTNTITRNAADIATAGSSYKYSTTYTIEGFEEERVGKDGEVIKEVHGKGMIYIKSPASADGVETMVDSYPNPYKNEDGSPCLPFVLFWKQYPTDCLLDWTSGNDLHAATISGGIDLTFYKYVKKFQSFKIIALKVRDKTKIEGELNIAPGSAFLIETGDAAGGDTGFEVADVTAKLAEIWGVFKEWMVLFVSNYGISPDNFSLSGSPTSGVAMKISNTAKLEIREDQIPIYRDRETELARISRIVWNYHSKDADKISNEAEFVIDFAEPDFMMTPAEEALEFEFLKRNNASSDIDLIMSRNPDLTREQAEERYIANKAFNERNKVTINRLTQPE